MIKVFISSTFRDLEKERLVLTNKIKETLIAAGMENFIPDGKTSQEKSIEELRNSDIVIYIVSSYYGSILEECQFEGCKANCPMKSKNLARISYTHCEYNIGLMLDKPHKTYVIDENWELLQKLSQMRDSNTGVDELRKNNSFMHLTDEELSHYYSIAPYAIVFKKQIEKEFCPRIRRGKEIETITQHISENLVKWYSSGRIEFRNFYGRHKELAELISKMDESVEVYGVGGIGKTTLIQISLLIRCLAGMRIYTIGKRQSYITGSGYNFFKRNNRNIRLKTIEEKITLNDIIEVLEIPDMIRIQNTKSKISYILNNISLKKIILFIDDFQLADSEVRELVKQSRSNIVIATRKNTGLVKKELAINGISAKERNGFIGCISNRFSKRISKKNIAIIGRITEGHPVFTEILVRNLEKINFDKVDQFKSGLSFSNKNHVDEFLNRVIIDILSEEAWNLLQFLSILNVDLDSNINRLVLSNIFNFDRFSEVFNELIDAGILVKKDGIEGIYGFSFHHIISAIRNEKNIHFHEKAVFYYKSKIKQFGENYEDLTEILFHRLNCGSTKNLIKNFIYLAEHISQSDKCFKRLINIGELLKRYFKNKEKAIILVALGNMNNALHRTKQSEKHYNGALNIYEKLHRENPKAHEREIAIIRNNLGNVYSQLRMYNRAEIEFSKSLEIREALGKKHLAELAMTQINLGNLFRITKQYLKSESILKSGLKIYSELERQNPGKYLNRKVQALINLGALYSSIGKYDAAKEIFERVLEKSYLLASKNPEKYLSLLAQSQNNLADMLLHKRKYKEAENLYEKSLKLLLKLEGKSQEAFLPYIAAIKSNSGTLYGILGKCKKAERALKQSLRIRKKLCKEQNDVNLIEMANTLRNFGNTYRDCKEFEKAKKAYNDSLVIFLKLENETPKIHLDDIADVKSSIGILYSMERKFPIAEEQFYDALGIYAQLIEMDRMTHLRGIFGMYNNLAMLYTNWEKHEKASEVFGKAMEVKEDIRKRKYLRKKYKEHILEKISKDLQ